MAINLKFDSVGNPEPPTIILSNRSGNKLGQLDVNAESIDLSDKFNDASEFTFTLNKYVDGKITNLWDKVVDFKLVYCKEWNTWFEIKVELDEATETVKTVFCTQLGQAELSQIMLFNIEINTEEDIERDDYKITILYDEDDPEASMLHRILEKAPHYSIAHVDPTIARIQRSFSFDGISIKDAFDEIGEEIGCLFIYNSDSDENGMPRRTISVYDLQQNCNDCGYRGEFTDICPNLECESTNIKYGYGEDTLIFVTADELATEGIQLVTDTDSVKNCFKLEAGDDLMTATIRSCNPNGSDYIWYFSDSIKEDMSEELVKKIEDYNNEYKRYYNDHVSNLDVDLLNQYNALVEKYKEYYNTSSTCLNCDYEGKFYDVCPQCGSGNVLYGKSLQSISTPITGYSSLMNAYYNTIDLSWYLKSSLMPSVEMSETNAAEQVALLTSSSLSPVAVEKIDIASRSTANSAVLSMAKVIVKSTYKVEIENSDKTDWIDNYDGTKTWKGKFIVTNYSDDEDTATGEFVSVRVNGDKETFIKQKIEKSLSKENTDDYSISGLFAKDYDDFCNELKKYALTPLNNFYDACESCVSILISQKVGEDKSSDLYKKLYAPYRDKQRAIEAEIKIREDEINLIAGVYNAEGNLITEGLQTNIEDCKKQIQGSLNFESYLGENLWLEFCSYRREDKYSNENYISDGLNNAELFQKALEFIKIAENEIYKSAELQHSISATLNNLLAIPKFKPLVKSFKTGNWIRVQVNDEIYKLRLLEYDIGYSDIENIPVEFSDVTKIKNGITDVEDILSQASSISSSYDYVQRQSKKGDIAQGTIEQWLSDGLNSANVKIKSNSNEDILITKNGLLARTKSDITDEYSPSQFKLTHNIMAYTTDGWDTVSTALGEHDYVYWDGTDFVNGTDYGLSTKFVDAGHIIGSQFIGGEIVSLNYKKGESGTYIDLIEGNFDFAGGKIVFNKVANALTLREVTIEWANTNAPEILDISGLDEYLKKIDSDILQTESDVKKYVDSQDEELSKTLTSAYQEYTSSKVGELDEAVASYFGLDGKTIIGGEYIISPYIAGGYLNITGDTNNLKVLIDPNNYTGNGYAFQVLNGDLEKVVMGVDSGGNAEFYGAITASSLTLGDNVLISTNNIDGLSSVATSGKLEDLIGSADIIYKGDITQESVTDENSGLTYLVTEVPTDDGVITYETYDAGDYIVFGRSRGEDSDGKDYIFINENGLLKARNAWIYGTIYATDGEFTGTIKSSNIIGESTLYVGKHTDESGKDAYWSWIDENGILHAQDAHIQGNITSSKIASSEIEGGTLKIGNERDEDGNLLAHTWISEDGVLSTYDAIIQGTIRTSKIEASDIVGGTLKIGNDETGYSSWISSEDGILHAEGAQISGTITATEGYIGGWEIKRFENGGRIVSGGCSLNTDDTWYMSSLVPGNTTATVRIHCRGGSIGDEGSFTVLDDGSMYANYVLINGGTIGGWTIDQNSISKDGTVLNADDNNTFPSLVTFGGTSPSRFSCGDDNFRVLDDGSVYASHIQIDGGIIGNFEIDGNGYFKCYNKDNDTGDMIRLSLHGLNIWMSEFDVMDISGNGIIMRDSVANNEVSLNYYGVNDEISWNDIIAVCKGANSGGSNGGSDTNSSNAAVLSGAVSALISRVDTLSTDVEDINTEISGINTDFNDLEREIYDEFENYTTISYVDTLCNGLSTRITNHIEDNDAHNLSTIKNQITELYSEISTLQDRIAELESK